MRSDELPEDASNDLVGPTDERDRGLGIVIGPDGKMRQPDANDQPDLNDLDPEE